MTAQQVEEFFCTTTDRLNTPTEREKIKQGVRFDDKDSAEAPARGHLKSTCLHLVLSTECRMDSCYHCALQLCRTHTYRMFLCIY